MKITSVLIAAVLGSSAANALAQQRAQPVSDLGVYVLGSIGRAKVDIDNAGIDASVRAAGAATSTTSSDDNVSAWKLGLGYQFNRNFAVEVSYADFDGFSLNTVTTGPAGSVTGQIDAKAYSLDLVGVVPLSPRFDLFARVGVYYWDVDARVAGVVGGVTTAISTSEDGTDWKAGVGARYNFTRNFGIQLEWERYNDVGDSATTGKSDVDMVTIGLRYRF